MSIIGVDAGGTWIKAGLFSDDLVEEKTVQLPSGAAQGRDAYFRSIAEAVNRLGGGERIGLALPGTPSKDRQQILYAANIGGMTIHDAPIVIREALKDLITAERVVAENDAACAALAEWRFGHGGGDPATYLLHLTWGTGIGTALVVEGQAQYGWEGGHMPLSWGESMASSLACSCGSTTDLEAYTAVPRLVERARRYCAKGTYTTRLVAADLDDGRSASKTLLAAAEEGDPLAHEVLREALTWMARGLHTMSVLVYPDVVTIGGGMMASDWLLAELRERIAAEASGYLVDTLQPEMVRRAQLGNTAGMKGAALLAQQQFA